MMCGWSYTFSQLRTYQHFQDVDFIDKGRVVLHSLFLNGFHSEQLLRLSVLGQINHTEPSIGQFLLEMVLLLDVSLVRVDEKRGVAASALLGARTTCQRLRTFHNKLIMNSPRFERSLVEAAFTARNYR